jgi:uncharacterized membrane protein (DUF373 family)
MTGMSAPPDDHSADPAAEPPASPAPAADTASRRQSVPTTSRPIWALEHVQDWVTVAVGVVLILLAVVLLISAIVDFLDGSHGPISKAAPALLDQVLLVLILVEIVYTVVLSLRAHRLVAQPFIVVGLIAVVRRILFVLNPGSSSPTVGNTELGLLIAMVAVFVAGLVVVSRFEKGDD